MLLIPLSSKSFKVFEFITAFVSRFLKKEVKKFDRNGATMFLKMLVFLGVVKNRVFDKILIQCFSSVG